MQDTKSITIEESVIETIDKFAIIIEGIMFWFNKETT